MSFKQTKSTNKIYDKYEFQTNKVNKINIREDLYQTNKTRYGDEIVSTKLTKLNKNH